MAKKDVLCVFPSLHVIVLDLVCSYYV